MRSGESAKRNIQISCLPWTRLDPGSGCGASKGRDTTTWTLRRKRSSTKMACDCRPRMPICQALNIFPNLEEKNQDPPRLSRASHPQQVGSLLGCLFQTCGVFKLSRAPTIYGASVLPTDMLTSPCRSEKEGTWKSLLLLTQFEGILIGSLSLEGYFLFFGPNQLARYRKALAPKILSLSDSESAYTLKFEGSSWCEQQVHTARPFQ